MGIRGVRVTTFSPMEMRAFGGWGYEIKKKLKSEKEAGQCE